MKYLIFLCLFTSTVYSYEADSKTNHVIKPIIQAFMSNDTEAISALITYPLNREIPIPAIENKTQLLSRFDEVFDAKLTQMIANSNLKTDWTYMGWRGIMLSHGVVWVDINGNITSVNYQSDKEKNIKTKIINSQKKSLHKSLRNYLQPILEWKTEKFHIRIDDLGDYNYRYVSWSVNKYSSEQPDLILQNGEMTFDGSGGNHYYTFKNGEYIYRCYVSVIGNSTSPPGTIEVYKGDKLLLSDDVVEVIGR